MSYIPSLISLGLQTIFLWLFKKCKKMLVPWLQSRKTGSVAKELRELWRKKWVLHHCDLDLWPKVTNFNRVRASAVSNHLAKIASKSVHPFGWNFVHKKSRTHRHTHRDKLQGEYNSSTILWRCKKWLLLQNESYHQQDFLNTCTLINQMYVKTVFRDVKI